MKLFDDIPRTDSGPSQYAESIFSFLNRSARPEAGRIRDTLEAWFSRYPASDQADLRGRIRSGHDEQHQGAFFELGVHELLKQMDCDVKTHEEGPDTKSSGRPDFCVTDTAGCQTYVEATVVTGITSEARAARAREAQVYDAINRMNSPDFFIGMLIEGSPASPPSSKEIRRFLKERLDQLDVEEVIAREKAEGRRTIPQWRYEHDGWLIDFYPIPKKAESRDQPGVRPIGARTVGPWFTDYAPTITAAILKKAAQHGNFDVPYVVAVDLVDEEQPDVFDVLTALFGSSPWRFDIEGSAATSPSPGVWWADGKPRYTRLSAVLVFSCLTPWWISSADAYIIHNAWARNRYHGPLNRFPEVFIDNNGNANRAAGLPLADVLHLPSAMQATP